MYKILALDGGGIKGVFSTAFLATVEEQIGGSVTDYFDLIVGTSTGGIIALGLGAGFSATEIMAFYQDSSAAIFPRVSIWRNFRSLFKPKHDANNLKTALERRFGDIRLGESRSRLIIPALNAETGSVHLYKTPHSPSFERDYKELMVTVAMATAAAPTYFEAYQTPSGLALIDGGMWANNPTLVGVVEAIGRLDWPKEELYVLNVGCTSEPLSVGIGEKRQRGLINFGPHAHNVFLSAQASASLSMADVLIGSRSHVVRVDTTVCPKRFSLDGAKDLKALQGLGESEARRKIASLRSVFFKSKARRYEPCFRSNGSVEQSTGNDQHCSL